MTTSISFKNKAGASRMMYKLIFMLSQHKCTKYPYVFYYSGQLSKTWCILFLRRNRTAYS